MKSMQKRLTELELHSGRNSGRWHRIIQNVGQSFADTLARYEARNGRLPDGDHLIVRKIV